MCTQDQQRAKIYICLCQLLCCILHTNTCRDTSSYVCDAPHRLMYLKEGKAVAAQRGFMAGRVSGCVSFSYTAPSGTLAITSTTLSTANKHNPPCRIFSQHSNQRESTQTPTPPPPHTILPAENSPRLQQTERDCSSATNPFTCRTIKRSLCTNECTRTDVIISRSPRPRPDSTTSCLVTDPVNPIACTLFSSCFSARLPSRTCAACRYVTLSLFLGACAVSPNTERRSSSLVASDQTSTVREHSASAGPFAVTLLALFLLLLIRRFLRGLAGTFLPSGKIFNGWIFTAGTTHW